jgi:four helix bundle protein
MRHKYIKSYKNLIVWQKAMKLTIDIYQLTLCFPRHETYGLTNQIRRSAVSIAANIAEGRTRGSKKEFSRFLRIALGSGAELEALLILAGKMSYLNNHQWQLLISNLVEIMKILHGIHRRLNTPNS